MKVIYKCEECKGDSIYFEAEVVWNSKNREFEYDRLTYTYCNDCEDFAMVEFYTVEEGS
jgi:hypothetical protein